MNLTSGLISNYWIWISWFIYGFLTLYSIWQAPWHKLKESDSANIYYGTIVLLLILWSIKAGIYPGESFHFLGLTTACLMFNWPFALIATQLLTLAITLNGQASWDTFALNNIIMGAISIGITHLLRTLAQRYLPHNFFIYIFFNVFFASAIGISLTGAATYILLLTSGTYPIEALNQQLLPVYLLLAFPEGLLNGIVMTMLIIYKPHYVATFYDKSYLSK